MQEKAGATVTANLLTGLGIDEFLTRTDGAGTRGLLTDALGSTVALGDGTGTIQTQYTYEPFGYATQTGPANTNSYKYTGREDDGSGLYYYRARYYHPRLQRFIGEDPIGFAGEDVNLYAYVKNNPVMFLDPYGESVLGKIGTYIVRLSKGQKDVGVKVGSVQAAVKSAHAGAMYIKCPSKDAAMRAAQQFGQGKRPIHEIDKRTGTSHYHDAGRKGPHFIYSLVAPMTISYYAQSGSETQQYMAAGLDLLNPFSLPNDLLDIYNILSSNDGDDPLGGEPCGC